MALVSDVDAIDLEVAAGDLTEEDRRVIRDEIAATPADGREELSNIATKLIAERRGTDLKS